MVAAGTYRGPNQVGWWVNKRVTVMAEPGARPVFTGAVKLPSDGWASVGSGDARWWYRDDVVTYADRVSPSSSTQPAPFRERSGPNLAGATTTQLDPAVPEADNYEQLWIDDRQLHQLDDAQIGDVLGGDTPDARTDTFAYEIGGERARRLWTSVDPSSHEIEWTQFTRAAYLTSAAAGTRVVGIRFERFASEHADGKAAVVVDGTDDVELVDVGITDNAGRGIYLGKLSGARLHHVDVDRNGAVGMDAHMTSDLVVSYSTFDDNNRSLFGWSTTPGSHQVLAGAKLTMGTDTTFVWSRVRGNRSTGLWFDLFNDGMVIGHNRVVDNAKHGVFVEVSRRAQVEDNVIAANATGVLFAGAEQSEAVHNTFVDNAAAHVRIARDTRTDVPYQAVWHTGVPSIELDGNLFADVQRSSLAVRVEGAVERGWVTQWGPNAYVLTSHLATGPTRAQWGSTGYSTLGALNAALGYETGGASRLAAATPSPFVDASTGDYRVFPSIAAVVDYGVDDARLAASG